MTDLLELAKRVGEGEGWDENLNVEVARRLGVAPLALSAFGPHTYPPLLTDLSAVVSLLERVLPGWEWCCGTINEDDMPWGRVTEPDGKCLDFTGAAASTVRALLAALLRAIAAKLADTTKDHTT